jgi:myo-inositol catabolism protein IolH
MRIALDPYMHRRLSLEELPREAAELGYEWIELSPRADFLDWLAAPRIYPERLRCFKKAPSDHGVKIASLLPMYRWASPHEDERQAAVGYWKKAIEAAVDMGVDTMVSEFGRGPSPARGHSANCCGERFTAETSEAAWWRSMEELVPIFEKERIQLNIEPHPEDGVETLHPALDMVRVIGSKAVRFLYCAPHTFYFGEGMGRMIRECGDALARVHVADTDNHKASSGLRYICNPPGAEVTIHQRLDIGQGEIDWDAFFSSLAAIGFDGVMAACVFAWEERADQSGRFMREEMQKYADRYWGARAVGRDG